MHETTLTRTLCLLRYQGTWKYNVLLCISFIRLQSALPIVNLYVNIGWSYRPGTVLRQKCPQDNIWKQRVKFISNILMHIKRFWNVYILQKLNNSVIYIEWKVEKTLNSKFPSKLYIILLKFHSGLKKT
jgi:hypothetical protein